MATELEQLRQEAEQLKLQIQVGLCCLCSAAGYFLCKYIKQLMFAFQ